MIKYEDMPEDNEELAKVEISFPYLADNSADSCPAAMADILDYLGMEVSDGERLEASDLHFIRTAEVAEKQYWIWRFSDPDGAECYVTVSLSPQGEACISYDENYHRLSPEQFMLGDYHNVF